MSVPEIEELHTGPSVEGVTVINAGSEFVISFVQLAASVDGREPSALQRLISFGLSTEAIFLIVPEVAVTRNGTSITGANNAICEIVLVVVHVRTRPETVHVQKPFPFTVPVYSIPAGRMSLTVVVPVVSAGPLFITRRVYLYVPPLLTDIHGALFASSEKLKYFFIERSNPVGVGVFTEIFVVQALFVIVPSTVHRGVYEPTVE